MKFVCPVCGYVEEFDGEELPADFKCPQCGVSGDRFTKVEEGKMTWAAEHIVGVAHEEGVSEDIIADLRANFEGECSEVGMYLAMARVAHREGYPEIGLPPASSTSPSAPRPLAWMPSTTPCTRWLATRPVMVRPSLACCSATSAKS